MCVCVCVGARVNAWVMTYVSACGSVDVGARARACASGSASILIQNATRVASLALSNSSTSSHKRHGFRKRKVTEHKMYFVFIYYFYWKHFSFYEDLSEILSHMWKRLHVKYSLLWSYFNETWILSTDFRKQLEYQISSNPSSGSRVVPCGQKGIQDKANSRFSQFWECA